LATGPYDPTRQYQLAIVRRVVRSLIQGHAEGPQAGGLSARQQFWSESGDRRGDECYVWKCVLRMSTRRRDRASEKEQAQCNGGRTGADPEADPLASPGGSLHYNGILAPQEDLREEIKVLPGCDCEKKLIRYQVEDPLENDFRPLVALSTLHYITMNKLLISTRDLAFATDLFSERLKDQPDVRFNIDTGLFTAENKRSVRRAIHLEERISIKSCSQFWRRVIQLKEARRTVVNLEPDCQ
ncbi:hypothetical protein T11_2344, partial [Trichinella zimbabwensis]